MKKTLTAKIIQLRIDEIKMYLLEFDFDVHHDWYIHDFVIANTKERKYADSLIAKQKRNML